ncbi:MAG: hypothetical protein OEX04_03940 [Acidimicrobiia bacterium]|nr:hypothetical protein [Acidimicrobiia bacterium]
MSPMLSIEVAGPTCRATAPDVPADAPLEDVLASMVCLVGDRSFADGPWFAYTESGQRIPPDVSLSAFGVRSGDTVYVARAVVATEPDLVDSPTGPSAGSPTVRAADLLPDRLGTVRRLAACTTAFLGLRTTVDALGDGPMGRARAMWEWTAYERRLQWIIGRIRLRRPVTIGVVSQSEPGSSAAIAVELVDVLSRARADRVALIDGDPDRSGVSRRVRSNTVVITEAIDGHGLPDARFAARSEGPIVVVSDPATADHPAPATYRRLLDRLRPVAGIIVVDCGPIESATLHGMCEQLVLVTDRPVDARVARMVDTRQAVLAVVPRAQPPEPMAIDRSLPTALGAVYGDANEIAAELAAILTTEWPRSGLAEALATR